MEEKTSKFIWRTTPRTKITSTFRTTTQEKVWMNSTCNASLNVSIGWTKVVLAIQEVQGLGFLS